MSDPTLLYDSPVQAFVAAVRAAKAEPIVALQYQKSDKAWALWLADYAVAEVIAEGLRLTGYEVSVKRGSFSSAVLIHDRDA